MYSASRGPLRLLRVQIKRRTRTVAYKSEPKYSPKNSPTLYRRASLSDISDPKILGFYRRDGEYFRKHGVVRRYGPFPVIDVISPQSEERHRSWTIAGWNYTVYFVRLDEILSEEDAPPKHFKLTRITVDVGDSEGLQKFGYLLGARGYLQEAHESSEDSDYEITLDFLQPILVPPTMLLNLIDDCGEAQGWKWEVDTKR